MTRQQAPQQCRLRSTDVFYRSRVGGWWDLASILALVLFWCVGLRVVTDFGTTWDENFHITYGAAIVDYFESGGSNDLALTYRSNFFYGGAFDFLGSIVMEYGPWRAYHGWHLTIFVVAIFGYLGVWRLGRLVGGPAAGFFSLCALILHPVFVGHSFNNPKDLPFAVGYVWAIYGTIWVVSTYPRITQRRLLGLGFLIGLAMCVRIAGLLTLGYCVAALAAALVVRHLAAPAARSRVAEFQRLVSHLLMVTATAWITMVALWPWALQDPIRRPFVVLKRMTHFAHHDRKMPFAGETIRISDDTPEYLLHYFGLKTPEFIVALCAIGLVVVVFKLLRMRRGSAQRNIHTLSHALLWTSLLFPPTYAIAKGSNLYDGLRHFLFLLPVMAVLTGLTAAELLRFAVSLQNRLSRRVATTAVSATLVGFGAWHTHLLVHLHPHHSVYFNAAGGGIEAAYENYDLDYYAASYNDASRLLQRTLWLRDRSYYLNNPVVMKGCWVAAAVHEYVPQNFVAPRNHKSKTMKADFFLGYTRGRCHKRHAQKPIYARVRRDGGTITVIRDLRTNKKLNDTRTKRKPLTVPSTAVPSPPVSLKIKRNGEAAVTPAAAPSKDPVDPSGLPAATRPVGSQPPPKIVKLPDRSSN